MTDTDIKAVLGSNKKRGRGRPKKLITDDDKIEANRIKCQKYYLKRKVKSGGDEAIEIRRAFLMGRPEKIKKELEELEKFESKF